MSRFAFAAAACAALVAAIPASAEMLPGYDRFDMGVDHRARLLDASVWYPAGSRTYPVPIGGNPVFLPTMAMVGPDVAEAAHPLVLLSHGSGGNMDGIGWLSAGLVARGAMVLAVNHPGSTSRDSSPRRSVKLGTRAQDLSAALDGILADPAFADRIDPDRISVVGFSLGGATALGLAGVRFDGEMQDARCAEADMAADCGFFLRGGVSFAADADFGADARDPRVRQAVAIDPGFVQSPVPESLDALEVPLHLINLGDAGTRMAAVDVEGSGFAARVPQATVSVIAPASHFTFLAECTPDGAKILEQIEEDPVCTDPEGADRGDVHRRIIEDVAAALGL